MPRFWHEMADGDICEVEGLSSDMFSVISCGEPEDEEAVGLVAWARTWLRLELLMVKVISCRPVDMNTRLCEVIT